MSYAFKIKNLKIKNKGILAPMLEYTTLPFRLLCKDYGASLVFTEMVHTNYISKIEDLSKISLLDSNSLEKPVGVQIIGDFTNKKEFLKSIYLLDDYKYFDIIDLNLGCPSKRITDNNFGSALLKNIDSILPNIKEAVETTKKPITIKTRLGFSKNNIASISTKLINTNISALTIHGRTTKDDYSIKSRYKDILKISKENSIPIIYNGDLNKDNIEFFNSLDFAGLMIGRSALNDPSIFKNINKNNFKKNYKNTKSILNDFLKYSIEYNLPLRQIKIMLLQLVNSIEHCRKYRLEISKSKNIEDIKVIINKITSNL
jgi:tRNA-dihydrouridine synthase B